MESRISGGGHGPGPLASSACAAAAAVGGNMPRSCFAVSLPMAPAHRTNRPEQCLQCEPAVPSHTSPTTHPDLNRPCDILECYLSRVELHPKIAALWHYDQIQMN